MTVQEKGNKHGCRPDFATIFSLADATPAFTFSPHTFVAEMQHYGCNVKCPPQAHGLDTESPAGLLLWEGSRNVRS